MTGQMTKQVTTEMVGRDAAGARHSKQRGSLTLFGIGLTVMLLFVGGFSVDLWRAHSERRALAEMADAAAAAGANAVDADLLRADGTLRLDPGLAEAYAFDSIANQADRRALTGAPLVQASTEVIVVQLTGQVEMTLLRILSGGEPFEIVVTAEAAPISSFTP